MLKLNLELNCYIKKDTFNIKPPLKAAFNTKQRLKKNLNNFLRQLKLKIAEKQNFGCLHCK